MELNYVSLTPVKNIDEIYRAKNIVKDNGENFFTNLYVKDNSLIQWILRGQIYYFSSNNNLFILRLRKEFWHLYFWTNDLEIFSKELLCLTEKINSLISVDLLRRGGGQDNERLVSCLLKSKFTKYISLTRMSCVKNPSEKKETDVSWTAELSDVYEVEKIIYENMNPLCEQIPDIEEIASAIYNRQILVARSNLEIAAILFFERKGISSTLRFWAVRKKYQGQGFGKMVYERYISTNADARRWLLWVRDDNLKVKQIYQRYGMNFDDLYDSVWVWKP